MSMTRWCLPLTLVVLAACSEDTTAPMSRGGLEVRLLQLGPVPAASATGWLDASVQGGAQPFDAVVRSQVERVDVRVTAVHARRAAATDDDEGAWVRLPVSPALSVNLMALPLLAEEAVPLPRGDLPLGDYQNLRLIVEDATITFASPVTVGPRTWTAGEAHPLRIPGPQATRIFIPTARFSIVDDDATVIDLVLNPGTSVQTIAATPTFVLMSPVLTASRRPR
jgi:hypothetical protein